MKLIGIISDTHSTWDERFTEHFRSCDEIWHAGDIGDERVIDKLKSIAPVRAVCGNIDGGGLRMDYPEEQRFEIEGCRVLIRHIVGYPNRYVRGIIPKLLEYRPTILIGGHSHILRVIYDQKYQTLFINPGAAGTYGQQRVRTLIRLKIDSGIPKDLEIIELSDKQRP